MKRVCLVCQCRGDEEGGEGCGASVVNFLLKIVLEVPGEKLRQEEEMEEEWRWICGECAEVVKQCKRIYGELREIWGKYRECKLGVVKLVKKDKRKCGDLEEKHRFLQEVHRFTKTYEYEEWTDPFLTERSLRTVEILELEEEERMSPDQGMKEEPEDTEDGACYDFDGEEKTSVFWNEDVSDEGEEESENPGSDPLADDHGQTRSSLPEENESWKGSSEEEDCEKEEDTDWNFDTKTRGGRKRDRKFTGCQPKANLQEEGDKQPSTDKQLATCPRCNKSYNHYYLPIHVAHVHEKRGYFCCTVCEARFFDKHGLNLHLKHIHGETSSQKSMEPAKDKHVACPHCHKRYTPYYLERHIAVRHDKRESFTCDLCGHSLADRYNLKRHYRDVHGVIKATGKDVLVCPVESCAREYRSRKCFESHMKEHGQPVGNTPKKKSSEPEVEKPFPEDTDEDDCDSEEEKNEDNENGDLSENSGDPVTDDPEETRSSLPEKDDSWKGSSGEAEENGEQEDDSDWEVDTKKIPGGKRGKKATGTKEPSQVTPEVDNPTKPFACPVDGCKSRYTFQTGLKNHVQRLHPTEWDKLQDLDLGPNSAQHLKDKPRAICPHCNKSYEHNYLPAHIATVHEKRIRIPCALCDKTFTDPNSLNRHLENIHGKTQQPKAKRRKLDSADPTISQSEPSNEKLQMVPCPHCHKKYAPFYLQRHIAVKHDKRENVTCDLCGKSYCDRYILKRHYRDVHGENRAHAKTVFVCPVENCVKQYQNRKYFEAHMKEHEAVNTTREITPEAEVDAGPPEKRWVCQACGKAFVAKSYLRNHQANTLSCKRLRMSESEAVLVCPTCGAQCGCPSTLKLHIKYVHQKKFKEVCHVCGSGLANKSQLAKHLARGHGIGDYPCKEPGCGKVFSREDKLEEHVAFKHRGQEGKYKCNYCPRTFFRSDNKRQHERGVHEGVKYHSMYNKRKEKTTEENSG